MRHLQEMTNEELEKRLADLLKLLEFDPSDDNLQHEAFTIVNMLEDEG